MNDDAQRTTEPGRADDAVPRLPRGRGLRLSRPELLRVAGLALLLVFLLATQRTCANGVSKFVTGFDDPGPAPVPAPQTGTVGVPGSAASPGSSTSADLPARQPTAPASAGSAAPPTSGPVPTGGDPGLDGYERLRPGMTDDEVKAVIDRARARAARKTSP